MISNKVISWRDWCKLYYIPSYFQQLVSDVDWRWLQFLNTGIIIRCKSGKLFSPFCRLCIVLKILLLCFYCIWLVVRLLWFIASSSFGDWLVSKSHEQKCVRTYWNVSIYSIQCDNWCWSIIKMYNTCLLEQYICLYKNLTCLQFAALSLSTVLRTFPVVLCSAIPHTSVLFALLWWCVSLHYLTGCQYLMSNSCDDYSHMPFRGHGSRSR